MPLIPRLHALNLTVAQFAALTDHHPQVVYRWSRGGAPAWVGLLLDAWERCPALVPTTKPHTGD